MLATDGSLLEDQYDVVVVGSGYGGAITAARLGFAGQRSGRPLRIALLERGEEHPTGTFPERELDAMEQMRHPILNPLGLYEYLTHPTVDVIQGCGLGGGSLINANVAIVPDKETLLSGWPAEIRGEVERGEFGRYYDRAAAMLGANPYASDEDLKKIPVFREISGYAGGAFDFLNIVVSKEDRQTRYGVARKRCINCGSCMSGCNVGAKNTLATNYLPMAHAHGVAMFTRTEVDHVEKLGPERYRLVCRQRSLHRGLFSEERTILADKVILAAGSLGTTGILLRSQAAGLALSPRLGHGFSGNGDVVLAFTYNSDRITDFQSSGVDDGPRSRIKAGPAITMKMRLRPDDPDLRRRITVEDLTYPRPLIDALRKGLAALAPLAHRAALDTTSEARRWAEDIVWNESGAINSTLGYLIMGHDNSDGRIVLQPDGSVTLKWPGEPGESIYEDMNQILEKASAGIGGTYLPNPRWNYKLLGNNLITAHPLGGCATADDADHGVVDHRGRVFAGDGSVHPGLFVSDGSVIPRALAVNPFLTISAFAERMAEHLRQELGLPAYDADAERDDR